ncbi:MAG: hypothetical protein UZ03_NOB001001059 [Nitrospira sp. OLB3]|nr:MAG: hypothetical protein UZ03_NOB001001059 [Nitrospira sp. OLB3]
MVHDPVPRRTRRHGARSRGVRHVGGSSARRNAHLRDGGRRIPLVAGTKRCSNLAWTALGLGIESMAWPIATMVQIRLAGNEPSDEQMETILNAVLFGLFTSVFWVTFAFGLFKRIREADSPPAPISARASAPIREKTKRSRS